MLTKWRKPVEDRRTCTDETCIVFHCDENYRLAWSLPVYTIRAFTVLHPLSFDSSRHHQKQQHQQRKATQHCPRRSAQIEFDRLHLKSRSRINLAVFFLSTSTRTALWTYSRVLEPSLEDTGGREQYKADLETVACDWRSGEI